MLPAKSGSRFFQFLDPVFEIVLIDSKLNEVSAQLCDRPLDPPAQMSKLAVNDVEAFELDLDRIKAPALTLLLSNYGVEPRDHDFPHRPSIVQPGVDFFIERFDQTE